MANTVINPKKKKKGMSIGFTISLVVLIIMPIGGLLMWYFTTAAISLSGSKLTASELIADRLAKVQLSMRDDLKERSIEEGFSLNEFDNCEAITKDYRLTQSDRLDRELLGISIRSSREELTERCILFAKIVKRMERLSHHIRHVVMCNKAEFTDAKVSRYKLTPDPDGRGFIETFLGNSNFIPIPKWSNTIIKQWQVFNIGDGCVVVGMSTAGLFKFAQN